jgi:hypothetical protein
VSRRSDAVDVARTVTSALRKADDLRRGRLALGQSRADDSSSGFLRGVALGALVGAAIAGSTIWERRKARKRVRREFREETPSPEA